MPSETYLSRIVARAIGSQSTPQDEPLKPKKSAYGLLARYGPGPTEEEIDENRKEMFSGFGERELRSQALQTPTPPCGIC